LQILMQRNIGKSQMTFDFPLSIQEYNDKRFPEVLSAAKFFISKNYKLPYYFGFDKIIDLSSHNIEQFLAFSSELFEVMISNRIKGDTITLSDKMQEDIIRKITKRKWQRLANEIPHSINVQRFLTSLGQFSVAQTFRPNAPYAPGITGFSVKTNSKKQLFEEEFWQENSIYEPLIQVLTTGVAYNLLEKRIVKQGAKGEKSIVYYLNRWLCVHFGLPFSYGGFRHIKIQELYKWIKL